MSVCSYEPPFFSYDDFYRLLDNAWTSSNAPGKERQRQGDAQHQTLARDFQPRMDIHESPKSNLVTAYIELPGLAKSNVNIEVQNNRIIVSGERNVSKETAAKGFVHRERQYGKFSRTLPLPVGVKPEEIKASMENGVLTITFPKTVLQPVPQRISIA